jgi:small subunit ribosomal protein S11
MAKATKKNVKKRVVKVESEGYAFIQASFNNIIVSITNKAGQVISWGSAGKSGFKGSKKNTPYAAQIAAADAAKVAHDAGLRVADVFVKGPGSCREAAIRAFKSQFFDPSSTEPASYISSPDFLNFIQARAMEMGHKIGVKYGEGFQKQGPLELKSLQRPRWRSSRN